IRRLQQYARIKQAAEDLDELPRLERDPFLAHAEVPEYDRPRAHPDVELREVLLAFQEVLRRSQLFEHHHIQKETLSARERMSQVLERLEGDGFVPFVELFEVREGRLGLVVTFLAVLELVKESLIELVQTDLFGSIHVRSRST